MATQPFRRRWKLSRSRLVALGLAGGTLVGLIAGMTATARPQPAVAPRASGADRLGRPGPGTTGAEPATNPFAGRQSITQTGAS